FIHRPSGTERVRRSVLMREGMIFSNQLMQEQPPEFLKGASILGPAGAGKPRAVPGWAAPARGHTSPRSDTTRQPPPSPHPEYGPAPPAPAAPSPAPARACPP